MRIDMLLSSILFPLLLSFLLGVIIIPNILLVSHKKHLFDPVDSRKVHTGQVPRLGGVAFFPVLLITFLLAMGLRYLLGLPDVLFEEPYMDQTQMFIRFCFLIVGMTLLYLIGIMDDLVGLSYKQKFFVQVLCASLFPLSGMWITNLTGLFGLWLIPDWLGITITVFIAVYITNAINLIDGVDGLASGMSVISLFTLGAAAIIKNQFTFIILCFSMAGVLFVFWFYNVFGKEDHGRKLFMGDTGSLTLGYLLSFLLIHMANRSSITFPRGILLMGFSTMLIPMFDIVRVVMSRLRDGRNVFMPDKNHIHHKLLRTGMKMREVLVTLLLLSLMFTFVTVSLVILEVDKTLILGVDIVLWLVMHYIINIFIDRHERQKQSS